MKRMLTRFFVLLTAAACLSGCGPSLDSSIATDGSTSMEKVVGSLGESYTLLHSDTAFTFNPTGSGSGIIAVAEGRCDIGLSSRPLKDSERDMGLDETVLAYDGLAVIVHPDNPLTDLDMQTVAALFTGQVENWQAVGGHDAPVVLIGREAGSGTRSGFEEITGTTDACPYRQELTSTGDVITTVSQNPGAVGYASLAAVKESVKVLSVDGVFPSEETIQSGSYSVQRPFLLITRSGKTLPTAAGDFFAYCFTPEAAQIISNAGAVPAQSAA